MTDRSDEAHELALLIARHHRIDPPGGKCTCGHETPLGGLTTRHIAEEILARRADRATRIRAEVEALYGGEPPPIWIEDTKIVRATAYRPDLDCKVTESLLRVEDVRAALKRAMESTDD